MSEKRGFVCRDCRWKLLVAAIVGGFVGAAADDLGSLVFAARTDPWVAQCESMLAGEKDLASGRLYVTDGGLCVSVVYPELPDREFVSEEAWAFRNSYRTVLDKHDSALRASDDWGEVRVRFQVNAEGSPVAPEIAESSGSTAIEAFALDLATTMEFTPVADGDAASQTWAEFPVAVGVRAP